MSVREAELVRAGDAPLAPAGYQDAVAEYFRQFEQELNSRTVQ